MVHAPAIAHPDLERVGAGDNVDRVVVETAKLCASKKAAGVASASGNRVPLETVEPKMTWKARFNEPLGDADYVGDGRDRRHVVDVVVVRVAMAQGRPVGNAKNFACASSPLKDGSRSKGSQEVILEGTHVVEGAKMDDGQRDGEDRGDSAGRFSRKKMSGIGRRVLDDAPDLDGCLACPEDNEAHVQTRLVSKRMEIDQLEAKLRGENLLVKVLPEDVLPIDGSVAIDTGLGLGGEGGREVALQDDGASGEDVAGKDETHGSDSRGTGEEGNEKPLRHAAALSLSLCRGFFSEFSFQQTTSRRPLVAVLQAR